MGKPLSIAEIRTKITPLSMAKERIIPVPERHREAFANGGLKRGGVSLLRGEAGGGLYSFAISLLASATSQGLWVALLNVEELGLGALTEAGANPTKAVVVTSPSDRSAQSAQTLMDSFDIVATIPTFPQGHALRLAAKTRERNCALLVIERTPSKRRWLAPSDTSVTVHGMHWRIGADTEGKMIKTMGTSITVNFKGMERELLSPAS